MKKIQKEILINYINLCKVNKPIFIEDIKENINMDFNKVYVYINRLIKKEELKTFSPGIYYKGTITIYQVIEKKYLKNNEKIIGYLKGDSLLYELGLIKNKPETTYLVSNVCYKGSRYKNNTLNVIVHKPRIQITNENYKYLQLFELIKLKVDKKIIYTFINNNKLNWKKIFKYAKISRNKKVLEYLIY